MLLCNRVQDLDTRLPVFHQKDGFGCEELAVLLSTEGGISPGPGPALSSFYSGVLSVNLAVFFQPASSFACKAASLSLFRVRTARLLLK